MMHGLDLQSGPPEEWWDCATECYGFLRNVHDKMADGKTAFEKRYGQTCEGRQFLFEHWLSTSQLSRKTSQEYIRLKRKR